tara:strand:- start:529 stop:837 length:309 start_codon:yes stop_codon:yes gene_type:complete
MSRNPQDPRIQRDNPRHDPYSNYSLSGGTIATEDVDRVIHYNNNVFAVLFSPDRWNYTEGDHIIANVAQPNGENLHNAYGIRWVLSPNDRDYAAVAALAGVA